MAHSHSHSHSHSSSPHSHPHNPYPVVQQQQQKKENECSNCDEEGGCNNNNKQGVAQLISRSKAANLARINLFQAIETGDLPLVHYLVTRATPMSIRTLDAEGNTPLHASAKSGHVDLILYFVDQGMPVDLENGSGHTPLMIALSYGQIAATGILIKLGADVNKKDHLGFSPVIHAAQFGNVFSFHHFISNAQVDINDIDNDGHSVLCWACYSGHKELLEYLLSENCPSTPHLGALDAKKRTAMHWAASQNSTDVCSFLAVTRCKLCPSKQDENDKEIERERGGEGEKRCSAVTGREMLEMRDDEGKTPADCAKAKGHDALAQALDLERSGIRATVPSTAPKKDESEAPYQFLSAFLPFVVVLFFIMPYLPWWGVLLGWLASAAPHARGMKWSIKGKTFVPAGLLSATVTGMTVCLLTMFNLNFISMFTTMVLTMINFGFLYAYYLVIYTDPGVIAPSESFYKRVLDTVASGAEPPAEYCRQCKIIKPPRSKHCRDCNACVDRFDHHCYWIANCVGKKNTRAFYLILLYCIAIILLFVVYSIGFVMHVMDMEPSIETVWEGTGYFINQYPQVFWVNMFVLLVLAPVIALTTFHTSLIARDATTYEMMTKFRSTPGGAPKPYSVLRFVAFLQHGTRIFGTGQQPPNTPASHV